MTLHKRYLLDGKIESDAYGPLAERIDYTWKIYKSSKAKYSQLYKEKAIEFIRKQFATVSLIQIEKLMALKARNPKKIKNYVPQLDDLRFQIDHINLIKEPVGDKLKRFIKETNQEITELNILITQYNNASNKSEQLNVLYQIFLKKKSISNQLPQVYAQDIPEYINIFYHQLFKIIQTQFSYLGITSLNEKAIKDKLAGKEFIAPNPSSLSELIANMAPEKIDRLLEILSAGSKFNRTEFTNLYASSEQGYTKYQLFLKTHSIEYLGGGNSENFKITNLTQQRAMVLKVDYRFYSAKKAETHLRTTTLNEKLPPILTERQGSYKQSGETICRSLVVTEFYKGSDLESYAKRKRSTSETLRKALTIYIQMGEILEHIVANGCAVPDMKNTNWLIENEQLKLGDTKSIAFIDKNGILDYWTLD